MAKISDLVEAAAIADSDLLHLRTSGGIDKKITGTIARDSLLGEVSIVSAGGTITLGNYTSNLTVINTASSEIETIFSGKLPDGRTLTVINESDLDDDWNITVNSISYAVGTEPACLLFVANSTTMIPLVDRKTLGRAWINYNCITNTIRSEFNISSVTDGGTGNYTLIFLTDMKDANYIPLVGLSSALSSSVRVQFGSTGPNLNSNNFFGFYVGSLKLVIGNASTSTATDPSAVCVGIMGN